MTAMAGAVAVAVVAVLVGGARNNEPGHEDAADRADCDPVKKREY